VKYTVIVEKSKDGFGAYVPDLPGCVAVGETKDEVILLVREAIEIHIESMKESGEPIPEPISSSELVEV